MAVSEEMGVEEESWANHYSSNHQILLVGDGDFSFSLSLAHSFGSASNIVASSLDSYVEVTTKYKDAESNLKELEELGASHLHGVDATKMKLHSDLKMQKFDRIIFNFPHAGFSGKEDDVRMIKKHKKLVSSFFANARGMLRANGEIHVNHKTTPPFCCWNLEELGSKNSLALVKCVNFKKEDYPGYNNKRGDGSRCNNPFPLGKCSTFIFRFFRPAAKCKVKAHVCSRVEISSKWHVPFQMGRIFEQPRDVPFQMQHRPLCELSNLRFEQPREDPYLMQHMSAPSGFDLSMSNREVPFQMQHRPLCELSNLRFEQPREAPYLMQHLSDPSGFDSSMSNTPLYTMHRRCYQPRDDPYRMEYPSASFGHLPLSSREAPFGMQHPVSSFGTYPTLNSRDGRYHRPQEAPLQINHPSAPSGFDSSMSNTSLYTMHRRCYQPQDDPYRMEYPSASFGHLPLNSRESPFGMQHPVSSFGTYPTLNSRDGRYHRPQEAPLQINYPSAAFDSDISSRHMPFVPDPYQIQEQPSLFDSIPRKYWSLRSQINDRGSWIHGQTGGDVTYPVLDRGPDLHYERFRHELLSSYM